MTARDELLDTIAALELKRARLISRLMVEELRGGDVRRVGQETSPLGRRKHIAAVKRRLAEEEEAGEAPGTRGAFVSGRRHLLTQEALAEELGRGSRAARLVKAARRPAPANDATEPDESELEERFLANLRRT